ncbi:MAG: hypothetical protein JRL30_22155 [Deltaproteobacteria bacterium]|nr:hypothetical protein [Deltaproteobacteria bacterium]
MAIVFSFVFPFFLVTALLQVGALWFGMDLRGWRPALIVGFISAGITMIPVGGLPLARWLISFTANFSIPLTAILLAKVLDAFFNIRLLDEKAYLTCWVCSIIAGTLLYPMAMGLSRFDPYSAGWGFSWLFVLTFSVTMVLLIMKNRFAGVLIAVILAYNLRLLESTNLWDYLIDPFLVAVSFIALGLRLFKGLLKKAPRSEG